MTTEKIPTHYELEQSLRYFRQKLAYLTMSSMPTYKSRFKWWFAAFWIFLWITIIHGGWIIATVSQGVFLALHCYGWLCCRSQIIQTEWAIKDITEKIKEHYGNP